MISKYETVIEPWPTDVLPSENPYHIMVYNACIKAIGQTPYAELGLPINLNAGIAFRTNIGENFPSIWLAKTNAGGRLNPKSFLKTIHSAAPGYASILLNLYGPTIVSVYGDIEYLAALQIWSGRTRLMLVCSAEVEGAASCFVLEKTL